MFSCLTQDVLSVSSRDSGEEEEYARKGLQSVGVSNITQTQYLEFRKLREGKGWDGAAATVPSPLGQEALNSHWLDNEKGHVWGKERASLLSWVSCGRGWAVLCASSRRWCKVESKGNFTETLGSRTFWLLYSSCICHWYYCKQCEKHSVSMFTHYFICSSWWIFLNERKP